MKLIGNFFYGIFYLIVRPFFRCKLIGKKNIRKDDEARVFVANHYEYYGPIIMYLRFNKRKRIWVINNLMDKEKIVEYMTPAINDAMKKAPKFLKNWLIKIAKNLIYYIMTKKAKGIPVYKDGDKKIMQTFNESVKALEDKYSIVIFPERDFRYDNTVGNFQTGFATIGKFYYKKTGKKLSFYPVFISKQYKTMQIGEPIIYNPDDENIKDNIVNYLHDKMDEFSKINPRKKK